MIYFLVLSQIFTKKIILICSLILLDFEYNEDCIRKDINYIYLKRYTTFTLFVFTFALFKIKFEHMHCIVHFMILDGNISRS